MMTSVLFKWIKKGEITRILMRYKFNHMCEDGKWGILMCSVQHLPQTDNTHNLVVDLQIKVAGAAAFKIFFKRLFPSSQVVVFRDMLFFLISLSSFKDIHISFFTTLSKIYASVFVFSVSLSESL